MSYLPSEAAFYSKSVLTKVFHIPANLSYPISIPQTQYILEEGQILLINFYLSLARFLSHTHICPPPPLFFKCNKVSVNLRNLMFILISNELLNRKTYRGILSCILNSIHTKYTLASSSMAFTIFMIYLYFYFLQITVAI